jgi:hypothetical protein
MVTRAMGLPSNAPKNWNCSESGIGLCKWEKLSDAKPRCDGAIGLTVSMQA